jgi:DNA-binding CsgD family transcriptional regulator
VSAGWPLVGRREELATIEGARSERGIRGVLVYGPAGVGKSRLADQALAAAERDGWGTGRAGASAAAQGAPLGALAHLLPADVIDVRADPVTLFARVSESLPARADGRPFMLLVDDLPRLDPASATLVAQLLDAEAVFLVGTVRSEESSLGATESVLRREHILRIDLGALSPADVDTLLHLALRAPVDGATGSALWTASQGNPLILRELVAGARARGQLVEEHGVWRVTGSLPTTPRLLELVESRLATVGDAGRRALQLLALREPVSLTDLEDLAGADALDEIDRAGLVALRNERRRQELTLVHPLYAEVLRDALSPLTRRRLLLEHAACIEAHGGRRRGDPLRVATARLDAGGAADPDLLLTGARLARYGHDLPQVVRLTGAVLAERDDPEAALLLAEAHFERGEYGEAERLVAGYVERPDVDDGLRLMLIEIRVRSLGYGLHRFDDALAMLDRARSLLVDPQAHDELLTDEAGTLTFAGHPREALSVLERLDDRGDRRVAVLRSLPEEIALCAVGRCESAVALAAVSRETHLALGDQMAIGHPDMHLMCTVLGLTDAGQIAAAEAAAERNYESAAERTPFERTWASYLRGRAALVAGRPVSARRWLGEAAGLGLEHGLDGPRRHALSLLATAAAVVGDVDGAQAAVVELEAIEPWTYCRADQEIGRGWAAAAAGDVQRARQLMSDAATWAETTGHHASAATLLHDIARLGDPGSVRPRIAAVAAACEGDLFPAYAAHVDALAARSSSRLLAVADRFEAMGAVLLAAEAATGAALALRREQRARDAAAVLHRAADLARRCEGARTPGLAVPESVTPLTAREREVAALAAERLTSREIAQRLYVSIRTVDNHLQSVYLKLGVSSRVELADALLRFTGSESPRDGRPTR